MKTDPGFYVGWQGAAPPAFRQTIRWTVIGLMVLVPVLAVLLVVVQRGFSGAVFEYGTQTILEGQLISYPVPFLRITVAQPAGNAPVFERVLLVGAGKHGAGSTLQHWEEKHGILAGKQVTLTGTLMYYEGKAALELTNGTEALLQVTEPAGYLPASTATDLGMVSLRGEISDPKCLLGVMKPGQGRPHRSCAVRCIAGGIPPVLYVSNGRQLTNYYLVLGAQGEPINADVLPHVGRNVQLAGRLEQVDNWLLLHTETIQPLASGVPRAGEPVALCR
jgi:hypothetical protein